MTILKKKDFPLAVLEEIQNEIQPLLNSNISVAHKIKDDNNLYHLVDNDVESSFFFIIKKFEVNPIGIYYSISVKPFSKMNLTVYEDNIPLKSLIVKFNDWVKIIKGYENVATTLHDDPIVESYRAEFERKFDILDEDADIAPFSLEQQTFINEYIINVKKKLNYLAEGKNEEEQKELKEIEIDASDIQENLTKETKRVVFLRLTRLWAKAQKVGLNTIKEIFIQFAAEITVRLLLKSAGGGA